MKSKIWWCKWFSSCKADIIVLIFIGVHCMLIYSLRLWWEWVCLDETKTLCGIKKLLSWLEKEYSCHFPVFYISSSETLVYPYWSSDLRIHRREENGGGWIVFLHLGKHYPEVFCCFSMIKYPPQRESVLLEVGLILMSSLFLGSHSYPMRNLDWTFNCCTEKQPCVTPKKQDQIFPPILTLKRPMKVALAGLRADFLAQILSEWIKYEKVFV